MLFPFDVHFLVILSSRCFVYLTEKTCEKIVTLMHCIDNKHVLCYVGNVVRAHVKEDENQKSKGYGTVQFETPMEALNAVSILHI